MKETPVYATPDNTRIYAIGDVHGYVDLLDQMHALILNDVSAGAPEDVHVVHLGDYIDRGPDSKGVIDRLIEWRDRDDGISREFLRGNYESGLFQFMNDPVVDTWLKWGGRETLESYGIVFEGEVISDGEKQRASQAIKEKILEGHSEFFEELKLSHEIGGYFFAHGGVDPLKAFDQQTIDDLTRIRQPFLSWHENLMYEPLAKKVVHGHSPSKEPIVRPHRIGIDTHAYESGVLSAVVLEGEDVRFLSVSNEA